jgi:hypothetical protein
MVMGGCPPAKGRSTPVPSVRWNELHRELMELNPSAARSLEEGMEETLTVHRLRVPAQLRSLYVAGKPSPRWRRRTR